MRFVVVVVVIDDQRSNKLDERKSVYTAGYRAFRNIYSNE